MKVVSESFNVKTRHEMDIVNLTPQIQRIISNKHLTNGLLNVFVAGSTAAITTIEFEPGLLKDLPIALERLAPKNEHYFHEDTWHDGNGHSHIRASLIGQSFGCPIKNGSAVLGTWQQIILVECDTRSRSRDVHLQLIGE